jgi:transcriptional regulator with XRE-family HTH domain
MSGTQHENLAFTHFGRQMRKERTSHGWSLPELSARTGINHGHLSRIERGVRPPTEAIALAMDEVFPERKGWFTEYWSESRDWTPAFLRNWREYEDTSATIRAWSPGVLHGLIQAESYARAVQMTSLAATPEIVSARLQSRMERQRRVLYRDDPPDAWFVVDELSLYRCVGSPEIMAGQMRSLAETARMPNVTVQVLPAVEHPANASEFMVTDHAGYVEHVLGGLVYTEPETRTVLARLFSTILSESYRASESLARIERMAETWRLTGARPATATPTDRASKSRLTTA